MLGVAPGRPAGEMDLRAQRGVSQRLCRPRLPIESELALDADGTFLGSARHQHQQSRRLHRLLRAADQGYAAHDQPLPHAGDGAGARCPEQHALDRALSQRRTARGHVRDRAPDRSRRPGARLRPPRRCAGAISSRRRPIPTPSASPTTAAITCRPSTQVLKLADWDGFARRAGRDRGARAAARHRARRLCRIAKRRAARARRGHGAAGRRGRDRDRHAVIGPGPCHQLRPARQRMAGRAARQGAPRHRRQRPPVGGRRFAFRPLGPAGRDDDPSGLARHHRPGPQARRPAARSRRSRHRLRRRAASPSPAPTAASACWRWRPSAGRSPTRPTSTAGSAPIPTAGMSARSRSMPRPGWSASTATPRSTMSAAR